MKMTKTSFKTVNLTSSGYKSVILDPFSRELRRVLNVFKSRDPQKMSIFYYSRISHKANDSVGSMVIKNSLAKIEKNIFTEKYRNRPWAFIKDVNETFDFIQTQHSRKSKAFQIINQFRCDFTSIMDVFMEAIGHCCGSWRYLRQRPITCNGNGRTHCEISQEKCYYRYKDWTYCHTCFAAFETDVIKLDDENTANKSQFQEYFHPAPKIERFVRCRMCSRKNHEICVLYTRVSNIVYYCRPCREKKNLEDFTLRAKILPKTDCDIFIDNFLKLKNLNQDDSLTIRLLSNMKKSLKVKNIIQNFREGVESIDYRNCSLFTFFETEQDADICFFSVFFQLYGQECEEPNRNTAYISYIDSVNLLSNNRTLIYRTILLGLFEFLKTKNFLRIYLWSCPPKQNQDYIFYMKPQTMKMPTKERLSNWYLDLFKFGKEMGVIDSFQGVHEYAEAVNWRSIDDIPYMIGDLWIVRTQEAIEAATKELAKHQQDLMKIKYKLKTKKTGSAKRKRDAKARYLAKFKTVNNYDMRENIWNMMKVQIRGFNNEYFVIKLTTSQDAIEAETTAETFDDIERDWINDRGALVDFYWEFMLEFSSERHAKYSTFMMLYRILVESGICRTCGKIFEEGVTNSLLCKDCHEHSRTTRYKKVEIPEEYQNLQLAPVIRITKVDLTKFQNDEMEVDDNAPTSEESSITIDSGFGSSPLPEDVLSESCLASKTTENENSENYQSFLRVLPKRHCRSDQQMWVQNRGNSNKKQSKKEKQKIVEIISLMDLE